MMSKLQGVVVVTLVIIMFAMVSIRTEIQQNTQDDLQQIVLHNQTSIAKNQASITINQEMIAEDLVKFCSDRNESAKNINEVVDALISGSVSWTPATRATRLKLWRSAKVPIIECKDAAR